MGQQYVIVKSVAQTNLLRNPWELIAFKTRRSLWKFLLSYRSVCNRLQKVKQRPLICNVFHQSYTNTPSRENVWRLGGVIGCVMRSMLLNGHIIALLRTHKYMTDTRQNCTIAEGIFSNKADYYFVSLKGLESPDEK